MQKKIAFTSFVAIVIAAGIYWFLYTTKARTPVSAGINAIPTDAAIIFESKQSQSTWKKLSQTNIMWEELLGTNTFANLNKEVNYIDSLLQTDEASSQLLEGHSVFISAHAVASKQFHLLFVYSLPNRTYEPEIELFFEKVNNKKEIVYSDFEGHEIGILSPHGKQPLKFAFIEGTLIMSSDQTLIEKSILQLRSGISLQTEKNFSKIFSAAGKKVDANIYLNYKTFPSLLDPFIFSSYKKDLSAISNFADFSGWDVTLKPNSLMLSGFTGSNDSLDKNFLNIFNKQKPQAIELINIIPKNTAFMMFYGISNTKTFITDHKKYIKANSRTQQYDSFISSIKSQYHLDIEQTFFGGLDNELALVVTESPTVDFTENSYAVLHSNDIQSLLKTLNDAADSVDYLNKEEKDTLSFRDHLISHLNIADVIPQLLGQPFNRIKKTYFTTINDYVIFGNSQNSLRNFINDFENNHTLANDKNYTSFAENISAEANVYYYSSIARSTNIYKNFVTEELSKDIENKSELFRKFESVGIQFTFNNKLFYNNISLKYNPELKQETGTLWESKLDSTVSSKPYLLINHNTKAKEVFVQDDANKIYLISNTGKVIWTKQLNERIMSDVTQVDVLKNNKLQMVFNTRSFIYMYDRNGNDMKGFPVKLKSPATNPLAVIDYENNNDYRLFIACENKQMLCFNAIGEIVTGFKPDKTANAVYLPVAYFNAAGKDHLCAIDNSGKVYILDRHGNTRVKLKEQVGKGIRNFYIESGKDYSKSFIVSADTLGNVIRLNLAGDLEKIKFQDFETSPYFEYRDINNDKTKEFIFLTRNELKVFNADKSLLFNYEFKSPITQAPQFFIFPDGKGKIGIVSETSNEIFLFNDNGSLADTFPLNGKTQISIGDLNNEGAFNIVTGSADNSIYVYPLK
jgi:hypothetical protein